jgi:hypothetical protein
VQDADRDGEAGNPATEVVGAVHGIENPDGARVRASVTIESSAFHDTSARSK